MDDIKFDGLIHTANDIEDVFGGSGDVIRVDGLTESEAKTLIEILYRHNIKICLIPVSV